MFWTGILKAKGVKTPLASLVQLVERRSPKPDVEGSSPSGRGFNFKNKGLQNESNSRNN